MPRIYSGVGRLGLLDNGSREHINWCNMQMFCMAHMLVSPTPSEAEECAGTYMRGARNSVLIVVGCCSVEYVGRARSTLGWGERIVIVKPDGSVLVHQGAKSFEIWTNVSPPISVMKKALLSCLGVDDAF